MLAHLDGILEPDDDAEIRQKIADSEFATTLMHRVENVMRQPRLRAPVVAGKGVASDANAVAEYLDNTLQDERVAEFEKACLESDTNLAEVGAAHQILTLVLGQPVDIDAAARERMYHLPAVAEEQIARVEPPHQRRERPTVPDYLREPDRKSRLWPAIGVVVAAAVVFVAILAAVGSLDPWLQRLGLITPPDEIADAERAADRLDGGEPVDVFPGVPMSDDLDAGKPGDTEPPGEVDEPGDVPEDAVPTVIDQPEPGETVGPEPGAIEPPVDTLPVEPQPGPSRPEGPNGDTDLAEPGTDVENGAAPGASEVAVREPGTGAEPPDPFPTDAEPPEDIPVAPVPDGGATPGEPGTPETPGLLAPPVVDAEPRQPGIGQIEPPEADVEVRPGEPGSTDVAEDGGASTAEPAERETLGRFISERQLLIRLDPEDGAWHRLPMQAALPTGEPILALPTFRPVLALKTGVSVQLIGGTRLAVVPGNGGSVPTLQVDFGRLAMHTFGKAGAKCRVSAGERSGLLTFEEDDAGAALHVHRANRPGVDPATEPAPMVIELWATRGRIVWQDGDESTPALEMTAPARVIIREDSEELVPLAGVELPDWRTEDETRWLDRRASPQLAEAIEPDRPAGIALRELADGHRQREVRWLAVRSLGYLGDFEAMVGVLDKEESKAVWPDYIEQLGRAVDRSPRLAAAVQQALKKQYPPEDAELIYRMLWGYTPDQLAKGDAKKLVDLLDSERLAIRVLAFWNLKEITGLGLFYRPEHSATQRQQSVSRWRDRLESGEIIRKAR